MSQILFKNFKAARNKANMVDFGIMSAGQDLSWIANNGNSVIPITFTYVSPGVYTMTTTNGTPLYPAVLAVYNNGVRQYGGLAYVFAGNVITFLAPYIPQPTDVLYAEAASTLAATTYSTGLVGIYVIPTVGGVATPNLALGNIQKLVLASNATLAFPLGLSFASAYVQVVTQDATGGRVLAINAGYKGMIDPATMVTDPNVSYIFNMVTQPDGTILCVGTVGPVSIA